MQKTALGFWLGVVASFVFFILGTAGVRFDAAVTAGEARPVEFVERVDQGVLSRFLSPAAPALGSVTLTKRSWGVVTIYSERITVAGARLASQAGVPLELRIALEIPGTVVGTNADKQEGGTVIWTRLPADAPLWVETRSVNWTVAAFLVGAAILSLMLRL
jgi:hypothetical protein